MKIGCDLVSIERMEKNLTQKRFLDRVFTPEEQAYCLQTPLTTLQAARFAARFAAKEACAKALGWGIGRKFSFHDLAVKSHLQAPLLSPKLQSYFKKNQFQQIQVSLSHEKKYALAFVLII